MTRSPSSRLLAACALAFTMLFACGFSLRAQDELDPPPPKLVPEETVRTFGGRLTRKDPPDKLRPGSSHKVHTVKLLSNYDYVIDLRKKNIAEAFDPYLRIEDMKGTALAQDDDSGGNNNARITFSPTADGDFHLIVTSFGANQEGDYELIVTPITPGGVAPLPGSIVTAPIPTEFGPIVITPFAQPQNTFGGNQAPHHGYLEYRFKIENRSAKEGHQVTLILPRFRGNYYGYGGASLRSLQKTVDVAPGATIQVSLFQPDLALSNGNAEVLIDGQNQERDVQVSIQRNQNSGMRSSHGGPPGSNEWAAILVSAEFLTPVRNNVFKSGVGENGDGTARRTGNFTEGTFHDPGNPDHGKKFFYRQNQQFFQAAQDSFTTRSWLGFSSYDGVVLAGRTFDLLPAESRAALVQYVECGGTLVLGGKAKVPDSWKPAPNDAKGCEVYAPSFGKCLIVERADPMKWSVEQWKLVTAMWDKSRDAWKQVTNTTDANSQFPIVENLGIPVRGLFLFMFLFVIVIGPLNLYWLSRANRKLWLLWTVPVFSLLTTGLLFTYMGFSEGWHAHFRGLGITILNENSQRAASIGWLGYYSPTTARGLHFSLDTELSPHLINDNFHHHYRRGDQRQPLTIDWSTDQHLNSGWITPKVPIHFLVRRNEKRLERLSARRDGDTIVVVNGLKADIKKLTLRDKEGALYSSDDITAGAEARLRPFAKTDAAPEPKAYIPMLEKFGTSWRNLASDLPNNTLILQPGSYVAILDDLPFFDQGLRETQSRKTQTIVVGILKDSP